MFHRVLPAEAMAVRAALTDIRSRFGAEVDDETLGRLELVLAEIMNNVAEHAVPSIARTKMRRLHVPSIHVCIVQGPAGLSCAVTDDGDGLPEACILPRILPDAGHNDLPEGGFGWFLIQDLTHQLCYYREDHRNFLAFSIPITA